MECQNLKNNMAILFLSSFSWNWFRTCYHPLKARVKWEDIGYSLHLKRNCSLCNFQCNNSRYIAHTNVSCFRVYVVWIATNNDGQTQHANVWYTNGSMFTENYKLFVLQILDVNQLIYGRDNKGSSTKYLLQRRD